MPQAFSHEVLTGSTNGLGIKVITTVTTGAVTVHTAIAGATSRDEVWLYAVNNNATGVTRTLTIEFGGVVSLDNLIITPIPPRVGPVLVLPGIPLRNTLLVRAFADVIDEVMLYGYCNRVTVT